MPTPTANSHQFIMCPNRYFFSLGAEQDKMNDLLFFGSWSVFANSAIFKHQLIRRCARERIRWGGWQGYFRLSFLFSAANK